MPVDPAVVNGRPLQEVVRQVIADVLVVNVADVQPGKALIRDLGAESIDFMDLVFRLEDELGIRIPFPRWQRYIDESLREQDLTVAITPEVVEVFAQRELAAA
jgi:acyl carrier protein